MKKAWETPKLVVLVRGKAEENLIIYCKYYTVTPDGPNASATACMVEYNCVPCTTHTDS